MADNNRSQRQKVRRDKDQGVRKKEQKDKQDKDQEVRKKEEKDKQDNDQEVRKKEEKDKQVPPRQTGDYLTEKHEVLANNSITLSCKVEGDPETFEWKKNNECIPTDKIKSRRCNISDDGKELTITKTASSDSGKYTCVATNMAGSCKKEFDLKVYDFGQYIVQPKRCLCCRSVDTYGEYLQTEEDTNQGCRILCCMGKKAENKNKESHRVVANNPITLCCTVEVKQETVMKWKRNDKFIPTTEIESGRYKISNDGTELTITKSALSDTGKYTCVAGSYKKEFDLKVYELTEQQIQEKLVKLYEALHQEDEGKLKMLLDGNAVAEFINKSSADRHLPLTMAALKYNKTMIQNLLDKGADIRNKSEDEREDNVLHSLVRYAVKHTDEIIDITETFRYLLEQHDKNKRGKRENNESPVESNKSKQDDNTFPQNDSESAQDDNRFPQDGNKSQQDNNKSAQENDKNSPQDDNKSPQDANKSPQDDNKSQQDDNKTPQDDNKSPRNDNKSPQDDNKFPQDDDNDPLWLEKNGENLTVLNLATAKGVVEIVNLIIEKQNYLFNEKDREFEYHDITHIDSITNRISQNETEEANMSKCDKFLLWLGNRMKSKQFSPSVLEMLAYNEMGNEKAHTFLQIRTITAVLTERWKNAQRFIRGWMVFHLFYMSVITVYSSSYADAMKDNTQIHVNIGFKVPTIGFAIPYFVIPPLSLCLRLLWTRRLSYLGFNIAYLLIMFLFGCSCLFHLVSDSLTLYFLIFSVITGWLFMTFFLSTFRYFSFFTVMFKRVFFTNLLAYSLVMTIHLISFTTAIYMLLKTGTEDHGFRDVLFKMFKLMVGLSELEDAENTESPGFSYIIYILFVVITYIVLMNALIAMMSEIFISLNAEFQLNQWRLEQLSVLLFMEETLFLCCLEKLWKRPRKGSKFILKYRKYPVDEKREALVPQPPKANKKPLKSTKNVEFQHSFQNNVSVITVLKKYVLTNKSGLPLATIVALNTQDSTPFLDSNGVNKIDVETHTPGKITLVNVEPKLKLLIRIEQEQKTPERSTSPKNKVHPSQKPDKDDNELNDQTGDNNMSRSHSRTVGSSNYSGLTKYVLTDKDSRQILAVYEHKPKIPIDPDILDGAFVIDVETHSPGLIILDDPDKGRKLLVTIEIASYFDDTSLAQQEKK